MIIQYPIEHIANAVILQDGTDTMSMEEFNNIIKEATDEGHKMQQTDFTEEELREIFKHAQRH